MFSLDSNHRNSLVGGKRPFHTIIPAFITKNGDPYISFGLMGGAPPINPKLMYGSPFFVMNAGIIV